LQFLAKQSAFTSKCFAENLVLGKELTKKWATTTSGKQNAIHFGVTLEEAAGLTHLNFIENKGFPRIYNNLTGIKIRISMIFQPKICLIFYAESLDFY